MSQEPPLRKVEFVPEVEQQALRIIATDDSFLIKWKGRLKPDHFNEPHIQVIFKVIDTYVTQRNTLPTMEMIYQGIKDQIGAYDNYQGFADYALALFQKVFRTDAEAVKDCVLAHMKAVDFDRYVIEAARLAADKKYDEIGPLLAALTVRHTHTKPVAEYLSVKEDHVASRVVTENSQKLATTTPWVTFNNKHGGGFPSSALSCFMGPTGSGKSIFLVNAGTHCVLQGKTVYHFTFELSEIKTKARYDVCLSGASYAERKANPELLDKSLAALKNRGKLFVIQISTGTCSAENVRAVINDHVLMGAPRPDVIILDYLTIMTPNNPENVDMKKDYARLKVIAEEVRALAMDLDLPVLSALQSNRGAAGKEKINKEDIADSYAVMHVLDCVLTINQTDAEKQAGKLRVYAAKVRDFEDCYTIAMDVNYQNLRIAEDALTTSNYNKAVAAMADKALQQRATAGIHAPLPNALVNPDSADSGLESIIGMGVNTVKQRNSAKSNEVTQVDVAKAAAWGAGHAPPPIASPS